MTMTAETSTSTRRQDILDAAAVIFAAKGYHGAGMRDIAERLGMKAGSLYFHLVSKEAALEEVCAAGLQSTLRSAERAVEAGPDLATRVHALIAAEARELHDHADYIAVQMHERRHLSPEGEKRLVEISRAYRALLDRIFTEAQSRGELAADIDVRSASLTMIGVLRNLTFLHVGGPIRGFDVFCSHAARILLSGIGGTARP
jgi:TetR/AcrR family transcriptional regulator, cholesterol catabolism regulator